MPIIFNPFTGNLEFKSSSGGGGGTSFIQGGNSFGALAILGTNDTNALNIRTNGVTALSIPSSSASAVNFLQLTNSNSGGGPTLLSQGSDANIQLTLATKGRIVGGAALIFIGNTDNNSTFSATALFSNTLNLPGDATIVHFNGTSASTSNRSILKFTQIGFSGGINSTVWGKSINVSSNATNATQIGIDVTVLGTQTTALQIDSTGLQSTYPYQLLDTTYKTVLDVSASNTLRLGNGFSGGTLNIIPFLTSLSGSLLVTFDIFMGALVAIKDPAGAIYLQFQQVVSAVNYFRINNAITGAGPILSAQGSDTNIDSNYQTKGTGSHNFSGRVNLGSGSTINAPLKLTSGTLTTGGNILPGNFEFLTDDFYLTGSTGNTRKIIRDLVRTDVSANITIDGNHEFVNATANTFTITLPTAVGYNKQFTIANSGTGIITINTTGGQTISNNVSGSITMIQFDTLVLRSNGVNWIKIN